MENNQGSYTQVVGDKEQVLEIQHKWKEGNICYFQLCKRADKTNHEGSSSEEEDGAAASGISPPLQGKGYFDILN